MVLLLLVSGCTQVQIRDETIYALKGPGAGAVSIHTLTPGMVDLSAIEWEQTQVNIMNSRKAVMCMSSDSFADWKAAIEKLCSQGNYCTYETNKAVEKFFYKMEKLKKRSVKNIAQAQ